MSEVKLMSKEDAVANLSIRYPQLSKDDISDLLSDELSIADKTLLIKFYRDAGLAPSASFWDDFLTVLKAVEGVINLILPITGAINGLYAVSKI
jgi:hypothetical protein